MVSPLPPECEQLLVVGYVLGNLSPAEAMLFAELVAENPELMRQVTEMQQALELGFSSAETIPPPALRDRILTTHRKERSQMSTSFAAETIIIPDTSSASKFSWSKTLLAIATALILGLGFNNYRLWRSLENASMDEREMLDSKKLVYSLQGSKSTSTDATAQLIVNPDRLQASLTVNNLPPLPPGKVYALWTVIGRDLPYTTDEKGAILTQVFQVDSQGEYSNKIVVPQPYKTNPDVIRKIAITIESESAPQDHTGSILISANSN